MAVNTSTGFEAAILGPSSFEQIFRYGCIEVRSGPQPVNADAAVTGDLLARITRDGGVWTPGQATNGLEFARSGRYALKVSSHVWRMKGLATGVAGWVRLIANAEDNGLVSTLLPRIDGLINIHGFSGDAQLYVSSLNITPATDVNISNWWLARPPLNQ